MTVPGVGLRVPIVRVRLAAPEAMVQQVQWGAQAVRANLPSTERLAYFGGLGVMALLGILEWPVAAAVGAGVWLAGHQVGRTRVASTSVEGARVGRPVGGRTPAKPVAG